MDNLTKTAVSATFHCLLGCAIGEVLGMVIGVGIGLDGITTVVLSIALAFFFGYLLSLLSLVRSGVAFKAALPIVLAADTVSILTMEVTDNLVMLVIPGAMSSGLGSWVFWASMALSLLIAFLVTVPVNRYLIGRGKGHALAHAHHSHHEHH